VAQCPDGSPPPCGGRQPGRPSAKSLAVLPFESLGGDTANAYFAEGLSDEVTTALSRVEGLRVVASRSSFAAAAGGTDTRRAGQVLRVATVLDGRVRRAGSRMRVVVRLTNAADGVLMWSNSYERDVQDIFAVQDDITREIVGALRVRFGGAAPAPAASRGTSDLAAWDLYQRGVYLFRHRGPGLVRAAEYLEQAIARDSGFARAHAALALVLFVQPFYLSVNPTAALPRARLAAERAARLDSNLSEAHTALGAVHIMALEWSAAEAESHRAIALDPQAGDALFRLGFILLTEGRVRESIAVLEHAYAVDPLYSQVASYLGQAYAIEGRADTALAMSRRGLELDSTLVSTQTGLVYVKFDLGRVDEAVALARRYLLVTNEPRRRGVLAAILARGGARAEAQAVIEELERMPENGPQRNAGLAYIYLGLGDTTRALAAMERGVDTDGYLLVGTLPVSHLYDPVRASPRFAAVLARLNLDPALLTRR
jgi:TolB-like protein/Tfp pilus assembly protein PilF